MNFKLSELETLFYSIKCVLDYMVNSNYEDRRFKMYLSNGQYLNFSINNNTLAHLLGVNTTYLIGTGIFKSTNSFGLLNELVENSLKIHNLNKDGIIDYNQLFSKHIINKVSGFMENIKLNIRDMEFICKYDKERTYGVSELSESYDYIIVQKLYDGKIGVLCLVRNNGYYAPMSNQIYDNYDSFMKRFKDIIKFQEITLVNAIDTYNISNDYSKNIYLNLEEKGYKISKLKLYKNDFNCSIDVSTDFSYAISKMKQNVADKNESASLIQMIIKFITNGEFIDTNLFEDSYLLDIVCAYNNFLGSYDNSANSNNSLKYSKIITNLKEFKEKVEKLEQENNELKTNYEALVEENNKLSSKNSELSKAQEEIYQIIKKTR